MPHTPFGGLSLLINLAVIGLGAIINTIKKVSFTAPIISHKHIFRLESTRIGKVVTPLVALLLPLSIFSTVSATSIEAVKYLYNDSDKVTVYDVGVIGGSLASEGYHTMERKILDSSQNNNKLYTMKKSWNDKDNPLDTSQIKVVERVQEGFQGMYTTLVSGSLYRQNGLLQLISKEWGKGIKNNDMQVTKNL